VGSQWAYSDEEASDRYEEIHWLCPARPSASRAVAIPSAAAEPEAPPAPLMRPIALECGRVVLPPSRRSAGNAPRGLPSAQLRAYPP
jgi:hypothetical protein